MIKSVYEVATESIPAMRERIAVLEVTCIREHTEMMMEEMMEEEMSAPPRFECQTNEDCDIGTKCVEEKCVEFVPVKAVLKHEPKKLLKEPEEMPRFEDIKQHVQQTGEVWSNEAPPLLDEGE